jgi:hypothetical protein
MDSFARIEIEMKIENETKPTNQQTVCNAMQCKRKRKRKRKRNANANAGMNE